MGIFFLQSYMEKHPEIYYKIDILQTITEFPITDRTIVVDGSACLRRFYGESYLDKLANGQYQQFYRSIKTFIDYFQKLHARLVVFFDGNVVDKKRKIWVKRRMQDYYKIMHILDALNTNQNANPDELPLAPNLHSVAEKAFGENCEIHISSEKECDEELLEYANKNNCIAIITQDTDFAMSMGSWSFWSIKDIDIDKHSVYIYDKKALAKHFGIHENQLPLMAALAGNDFINSDMLQNWHKKIMKYGNYKDRRKLFHKIAHYVKQSKVTLSQRDIERISIHVFNDITKSTLIEETISAYMGNKRQQPQRHLDDIWGTTLKKIEDMKILPQIGVSTFHVLKHRVFNLSTVFDDHRLSDLPLSGLFWRPLRAKIYGILFMNHPNKSITIEEWVSAGLNSLNKPTYVEPIPPKLSNFNVLDIWVNGITDSVREIGWNILHEAVNFILRIEDLITLPQYILPSLLTVAYMKHNSILTLKECRYFLQVSIICNFHEDAASLVNRNDVKIHSKPLRLASIYLRGITTMKMLIPACGFLIESKYIALDKIFDAIVFHHLYNGNIVTNFNDHTDLMRCIKLLEQSLSQAK
uniref:Putative constitutive coactivator n=1 Tax=Xenopsylla cheopis TaxID=163159 RepID=A0A6M2DFH2_XENCH